MHQDIATERGYVVLDAETGELFSGDEARRYVSAATALWVARGLNAHGDQRAVAARETDEGYVVLDAVRADFKAKA